MNWRNSPEIRGAIDTFFQKLDATETLDVKEAASKDFGLGRISAQQSVDNPVQKSADERITLTKPVAYGTLHHFRALLEAIEKFGEHFRV